MFNNIEQLEKEIEQFRNNLLASDRLVTGLENICESIEKQANEFEEEIKQITNKIDSNISLIEQSESKWTEANKSLLETVKKENDELKGEISLLLETSVQALVNENQTTMKEAMIEFKEEQQKYLTNIEQIEKTMSEREASLNEKYKDFMELMCKMDVSDTNTICRDIKKSLNTKTSILLVGVVISIVLGTLSLFVI